MPRTAGFSETIVLPGPVRKVLQTPQHDFKKNLGDFFEYTRKLMPGHSKLVDFDPYEWREFMPGMFYRRDNPEDICFLCNEPKEETKEETKSDVATKDTKDTKDNLEKN